MCHLILYKTSAVCYYKVILNERMTLYEGKAH